MRIQKYLSEQGICSRREAEDYIRRGLVTVNGSVVREMGIQIEPGKDVVEITHGKAKKAGILEKVTIVLNKPRGIVSSVNSDEGKTIYDLLPELKGLNIVGRLDKHSDGLLMLTNDGVIARKVTGEEHLVEKEYEVRVQEQIAPNTIAPMQRGLMLDDGPTLPAKVKLINNKMFRIILREGRKHQIRRMCENLHLTVTNLTRVRIGAIALQNLRPGEYRQLTAKEIAELKNTSQ